MDKNKVAAIVLLIGYVLFTFGGDLKSLIPSIPSGPQVSQEVKEFGEQIKPYLTQENKQDFANIGNMLVHEGNLFKMNPNRYSDDRSIKAKLDETIEVSKGYQYGVDTSKHRELCKLLIEKLNSRIGAEGFTTESASRELKFIGQALNYAARGI